MDFQIINNKGVYELHGHFIEEHTFNVASYFNTLLDKYYEIVICLNGVKQIDKTAINVMRFIQNKAKQRSKTVFVLGKDNKKIKDKFKQANLTNIFRNDYYS
ncbi:hypothetical protein [Hyunsoonleella ulvae]|uniref:hypothetical protein n=1 Tax=Hyunsoonleella ulvae TaxID=2799948 RepID=UPI00193A7AEF|nr:hypothetical protein [Hyunsoonleella ulvae]